MLSTSTETVIFQNTFTTVLTVSAGTDTGIGIVGVPTVVASFTDSGVTVITSSGSVTITGAYQEIIPITWYWKDLNDQLQTGTKVPPVGTYEKIVQVDSPPSLTEDCVYTITSELTSGTVTSTIIDVFTHTVTLESYSKIKTALLNALAGQPTPPMP